MRSMMGWLLLLLLLPLTVLASSDSLYHKGEQSLEFQISSNFTLRDFSPVQSTIIYRVPNGYDTRGVFNPVPLTTISWRTFIQDHLALRLMAGLGFVDQSGDGSKDYERTYYADWEDEWLTNTEMIALDLVLKQTEIRAGANLQVLKERGKLWLSYEAGPFVKFSKAEVERMELESPPDTAITYDHGYYHASSRQYESSTSGGVAAALGLEWRPRTWFSIQVAYGMDLGYKWSMTELSSQTIQYMYGEETGRSCSTEDFEQSGWYMNGTGVRFGLSLFY